MAYIGMIYIAMATAMANRGMAFLVMAIAIACIVMACIVMAAAMVLYSHGPHSYRAYGSSLRCRKVPQHAATGQGQRSCTCILMIYVVMATARAYRVMAYIGTVCRVMAYIVMAYIVMAIAIACIVMACMVMAISMVPHSHGPHSYRA